MQSSRWLIGAVAALAIIAIAVVVVALGADEGDESGEIISVPSSYEEVADQIESDPELIVRLTIPDEKSAVVEESTGSSYTIELAEGEAATLTKTAKSAGIEVATARK